MKLFILSFVHPRRPRQLDANLILISLLPLFFLFLLSTTAKVSHVVYCHAAMPIKRERDFWCWCWWCWCWYWYWTVPSSLPTSFSFCRCRRCRRCRRHRRRLPRAAIRLLPELCTLALRTKCSGRKSGANGGVHGLLRIFLLEFGCFGSCLPCLPLSSRLPFFVDTLGCSARQQLCSSWFR